MTQVAIHHADDVRARDGEAVEHRGSEPQLSGAMDDPHAAVARPLVGDRAGAVGGVVVDDDDLDARPSRSQASKTRSSSTPMRSRSL